MRKGKERGDSLSREILAQSHLLNTVIAAANANANATTALAQSPTSSSAPLLGEDETKHIELPVVQLYGVFETREHFAIEMELMQSRDLSEHLSLQGEFTEEQVRNLS